MPQMEALIVTSQTMFICLFFAGYAAFVRTTLPLVSKELKLRSGLLSNSMGWLSWIFSRAYTARRHHVRTLAALDGMLAPVAPALCQQNIFFGVYHTDLLSMGTVKLATGKLRTSTAPVVGGPTLLSNTEYDYGRVI